MTEHTFPQAITWIAWAAGLFEGEGCTTRSGDAVHARLTNTDEWVVRRFCSALAIGTVYGPYTNDGAADSHLHKRKPFWVRVARDDEAWDALELLAPWLSKRRIHRAQELFAVRFPGKRVFAA